MTMTPEMVLRTWFEELWNRGREETIDALLDPHVVIHGLPTPDGRPIRGPQEFRPFYRRFREAFPDIHVELEHVIVQGDLGVAHCRVSGTHHGDTLGFQSTGRPTTFDGFALGRFADGRLVEAWNCFDFMGMYGQLGVPLALPE